MEAIGFEPTTPCLQSRRSPAELRPLTGTLSSRHEPGPKVSDPRTKARMGQGGLEPPTPRLSSVCSNQLSYWPKPEHPSCKPRHLAAPLREGCAAGAPPGSLRARTPPRKPHPGPNQTEPRERASPASTGNRSRQTSFCRSSHSREPKSPPRGASLKGGDPAAGSPTATLLRLHPSR
jgi:hypothetical protein